LAAYGIDTAADIESSRVYHVPGFGPTRVATLVGWRRSIERTFVFDATRAIDPADYAMIDRQIIQKRASLESALTQGAAAFKELHDAAIRKRRGLEIELRQAARRLADAHRSA
jgi:DNA-binding helix-hairpin-helix protein with protein kinase domain